MQLYDRSPGLFIVVLILIPPAFITLGLRCYVRWAGRAFGSDDWCMVLSAPFFAWLCASCMSAAIHGFGAHTENFHGGAAGEIAAFKDFFFFELSYCIGLLFTKLSIGLMLCRVASSKPTYVWILRAVMALQSSILLIITFYVLTYCHPIQYAWDKSISEGHCAPANIITVFSYVLAAINIVFDWTCALLPIPLLWNVQLNTQARVAACILLSFGIFASACALVRLKYNIGLSAANDYFYNACPVLTYGFAEAGVGMVAANSSTLRPLFRRFFGGGTGHGDSNEPARRTLTTFGSSRYRRSLRDGTIELQDSKHGIVDVEVKGGAASEDGASVNTMADDESARQIFAPGRGHGQGGITVTHKVHHAHQMV